MSRADALGEAKALRYHSDPMPRKIRQLIADLERAGFTDVSGGKGSHRKFRHTRFPGSVIVSGGDGEDAHHYQEKQVRNAIRQANE